MNEYTREEGGEEVQDGEGVKRLVHNVESGDLCGDATTPSEMTACLLEGGTLLRSVSDATCAPPAASESTRRSTSPELEVT